MENREQQILAEIKSMMDAIRIQIEQLDSKMAELRHVVEPEDFEVLEVEIDEPFVTEGLTVEESEPEPAHEPVIEQDDDLPEAVLEPEIQQEPIPSAQAVIDTMIAKQPWRTDMPGTPVKDIRSAISLNDRVIFINNLFHEDPIAFQTDLNKINQMGSLNEVVEYVTEVHPDWNLESEVVYRFMMAVRRRIR